MKMMRSSFIKAGFLLFLLVAALGINGAQCVQLLTGPPGEENNPPAGTTSAQMGCVEEDSYTENFDSGWASDWYLGPGFEIVDDGSGKALQGGGVSSSRASYLFGDYWTDFSFSFNMKLNSGEFRTSLRYNSDGVEDYPFDRLLGEAAERYFVNFTPSGVVLGRTEAGAEGTMGSAATSFNPNESYAIRLEAVGGRVSVYVSEALLLSATDANPIPSGSIYLELEAQPNSQVRLDDIQVVAQVPCESTWMRTETTPSGGDINVIAVDPQDSKVVYAGTEHMGVWKSADGGRTWAEVGYSGGMSRLGKTTAIAVAPSDSQIVFASWAVEVDKSADAGLHWTRTGLLNTPVRIRSVAVDPENPNVVYAGLGAAAGELTPEPNSLGIFKSSDGGESWEKLSFTSSALSIAISASASGTLYVGSTDGVYRSTDGGASWTKVYNGAGPQGVPSVAAAPRDSNTVFAVADGIIKSTDGGSNWSKIKTEGGSQIVVSPSDPDVLYLLAGGNIFRSGDGGGTWAGTTRATDKPYTLTTIAADSSNPNKIYMGTWGQGLFFSEDGGKTWQKPDLWTMPAEIGPAIAADPSDDDRLYVGTSKGEVYVSDDKGATWTWLVNLGTGSAYKSQITGLVVDPLDPDTIYASNVEGVYKSEDGGASWREIKNGLDDPRIISLALDPKNPNKLFAGTGSSRPRNVHEGTGMFYSTNGGETWSHVEGLPDAPIPAIVISPIDPDVIYAAAMDVGVFKSVDGGESWSQVNNGLENFCVYTLAIDPENPDVAYAGTSSATTYCKTFSGKPDNVYKTEDGGENWKVVLEGEDQYTSPEVIAVDPSDPDNVYVATHTEKVWFSQDAGSSWRLANKGVIRHGAHLYLYSMAFDSSGSTLYIGTCGQGVLRNDVKDIENSSVP